MKRLSRPENYAGTINFDAPLTTLVPTLVAVCATELGHSPSVEQIEAARAFVDPSKVGKWAS